MASHKLREYIKETMGSEDATSGWGGEFPRNLRAMRDATLAERNKAEMELVSGKGITRAQDDLSDNEWAVQMYLWGRRVRRDILAIERHLKATPGTPPDLYGDPGDPPPPPPDW